MPLSQVTDPLLRTWKKSLAVSGYAVCVHQQCQLCFLSLSGILSHHRTCTGWTSPVDYLPCPHCGARFKQFKSCQTHVEKSHKSIFKLNQPVSHVDEESKKHMRHPTLTSTPDLLASPSSSQGSTNHIAQAKPNYPVPIRVRRPDGTIALLMPASSPSSSCMGQNKDEKKFVMPLVKKEMKVNKVNLGYKVEPSPTPTSREYQASSSSVGRSYCAKEEVLADKEVQLTQLESLVEQAEMKAEQARKARELKEWEKDLQKRENEARRRLAQAERMLRENSITMMDSSQEQYDDPHSVTPEDLVSLSPNSRPRNSVILPRRLASSPTDSGGSADSSFSHTRQIYNPTIYTHNIPTTVNNFPNPPMYNSTPIRAPQQCNRNNIPIVLPSTARLPQSAIRLNPQSAFHAPSAHYSTSSHTTPPSSHRIPDQTSTQVENVQDTPINLSKSNPEPTFSGQNQAPRSRSSPVLRRALLAPLTPKKTVRTLTPTSTTTDQNFNIECHSTQINPSPETSNPTLNTNNDMLDIDSSVSKTLPTTLVPLSPSSTMEISPNKVPTIPFKPIISSQEKYPELSCVDITNEGTLVDLSPSSNMEISPVQLPTSPFKPEISPSTTMEISPTEGTTTPFKPIISSPEKSPKLSCVDITKEGTLVNLSPAINMEISPAKVPTSPLQPDMSLTENHPKLPCVDITKETVMEMQVSVVEDGCFDPFNNGGANISFPLNNTSMETSFLFGDNLVLEDLLKSSGGEMVTLLATEGEDGMMTLVPNHDVGNETLNNQVEAMENELENIKKNMKEIRNETNMQKENLLTSDLESSKCEVDGEVGSPFQLNSSKGTNGVISEMCGESLDNLQMRIAENTVEPGGDLVEYFEMRLKEFESEIVQGTGEISKIKNKDDSNSQKTKITVSERLKTEASYEPNVNKNESIKHNQVPKQNSNTTTGTESNKKNRKKRRKDCPGTAWFGCKRQAKKKKVDESDSKDIGRANCNKNEPSQSSHFSQVSNSNKKRRSTRFQPEQNSDPLPSLPSPTIPVVSSILRQQFNCGRCSSVLLSEHEWRRHRALLHGGSARLAGSPLGQIFTLEEENRSMREAFAMGKRVNCPRCNKTAFQRRSLLVNHMKTCRMENISTNLGSSKIAADKTASPVKCENGTRARRKAATKAQGRVAEFVRQMTTRFEGESSEAELDEDISEDSDDNYDVKREVGASALYKLFRNDSKRIVYLCTVCNEKCYTKEVMESHIVTEHQTELLADDEESCDDEYDSDSDYDECKPQYKQCRSEAETVNLRRPILEPCSDMANMELDFRSKFYRQNTFSCIRVNMDMWVPEGNESSFLPTNNISARFIVSNLSNNEGDEEVRVLERFSGGLINGSLMMFCGGPVLAMAWCPLDITEKVDQVMAVVAKLSLSPSSQTEENGGLGLIQLWKVGGLKMEEGEEAPSFQFGIGHSYGRVRGLEWCPSGGKLDGRLGILAAACSDGSVRVWAVPSLDTLQEEGRIYQKDADLSLVCGEEERPGQCLSLCWYRGPGHKHIAASFSSGLVSIWDLSTTSPLLWEGNTILPWQTLMAHTGSVTGLSLCPGEEDQPRYLVTGGSDRCYRFWDLRDPSVPMQEVKRGMVSGVRWISGWSAASVIYDDVYLQGHTQTLITETGYHSNRSHPVIAQNSSVLDQDISHWSGTIATGTAAGELIVFVVPPVDKSMEHDKNVGQRRSYVFRTEVDKESKEEGDLRGYENMREAGTIRYMDMPVKKAGQNVCPTEEIQRVRIAERMGIEDLTCFPLTSINRVAWNNNVGYQLWLASGGQAGLVRAHCVAALNTGSAKKVFTEVMEKMQGKVAE